MPLTERDVQRLRSILILVDFFGHLNREELNALTVAFEQRPFAPGEVIVRQGDPGEDFFVVASGAVSVVDDRAGGRELRVMGAFSYFGELALITDTTRTATVRGKEGGELFVLPRRAFERMLRANPGIARTIEETGAERLSSDLETPHRPSSA